LSIRLNLITLKMFINIIVYDILSTDEVNESSSTKFDFPSETNYTYINFYLLLQIKIMILSQFFQMIWPNPPPLFLAANSFLEVNCTPLYI
ncbi:hypothetical protein L9F63_012589, partial [Diploptera punctata]